MGRSLRIPVLHTNDYHGQLRPRQKNGERVGGAAYRASLMQSLSCNEGISPITVDTGDFAQGSLASKFTGGQVVIREMNAERFIFAVIGNHDLEWGMGPLKKMAMNAEFPFLSANIRDGRGNSIPWLKPYHIHVISGIRIGFIGLTPVESVNHLPESERGQVTFMEPQKALRRVVDQLRGKVNLLVAGSHLGFDESCRIAWNFSDEIRLVQSAHTHKVLPKGERINGTLVTEGGSHGEFMGLTELFFNRFGNFLGAEEELHRVETDKIMPDRKVGQIVQDAITHEERTYEQTVGYSEYPLLTKYRGTSNFLEILADAMQVAGGTPYAMVASNNLVRGISSGTITQGDLYASLPWDEHILRIRLSGRELKEALEFSFRDASRVVLIPSGFQYQYDWGAPQGKRISEIHLNGRRLRFSRDYEISVNEFDFRANPWLNQGAKRIEKLGMFREALENYILENTSLTRKDPDGRIQEA